MRTARTQLATLASETLGWLPPLTF